VSWSYLSKLLLTDKGASLQIDAILGTRDRSQSLKERNTAQIKPWKLLPPNSERGVCDRRKEGGVHLRLC
jgi:hypothetical protein